MASQTVYQNDDGSGTATTSYAYSWYATAGKQLQMKERRTVLPAVSAAENGPNTSATQFEFYNNLGQLVWSADENGRFTHYEYDPVTGRLETVVADSDDAAQFLSDTGGLLPGDANLDNTVDGGDLNVVLSNYGTESGATWAMGDFNGDGAVNGTDLNILFSNYGTVGDRYGWPSVPGQGVDAQTDYQRDALGRVTQTLGPAHLSTLPSPLSTVLVRSATWTVYKDADHETWTTQGYATQDGAGRLDRFHPRWPDLDHQDRPGRPRDRPDPGDLVRRRSTG